MIISRKHKTGQVYTWLEYTSNSDKVCYEIQKENCQG